MLYIRTGKPGHGKTLNTIKEVDASALSQNRVVYFHNVTGLDTAKLKAEWYEFDDPEKWFQLPHNSIIVIDEAQGWFGTADPRAAIPEHLSHFEIMRKSGFEVHLITQDPRYIHVHARRIAHVHVHYWRVMRSQQLIRYENEGVIERVENHNSFKDADKSRIRIDKKMFDVYKSTNAEHHFKFEPSKKLIISIIVIIAALFLVFRVYLRYSEGTEEVNPQTVTESVSQAGGNLLSSILPGAVGGAAIDHQQTVEQYLNAHVPRMPDIPSSAPVYDDLTVPVTYPKLFCVSSSDPELISKRHNEYYVLESTCQCYTQQVTKFHTTFEFCMTASQDGYFDHAIPDRQKKDDFQVAGSNSFQQFPQNTDSKKVRVDVIPHEKPQSPFMW